METADYQKMGYKDRLTYLEHLARTFDVPMMTVKMAAAMLGSDEDFDALVTYLEDYTD